MYALRNLAALITLLLAVPVGVLVMVFVLPLVLALAVLALPALAGMCVLERIGVPGARELKESLSEALGSYYGD